MSRESAWTEQKDVSKTDVLVQTPRTSTSLCLIPSVSPINYQVAICLGVSVGVQWTTVVGALSMACLCVCVCVLCGSGGCAGGVLHLLELLPPQLNQITQIQLTSPLHGVLDLVWRVGIAEHLLELLFLLPLLVGHGGCTARRATARSALASCVGRRRGLVSSRTGTLGATATTTSVVATTVAAATVSPTVFVLGALFGCFAMALVAAGRLGGRGAVLGRLGGGSFISVSESLLPPLHLGDLGLNVLPSSAATSPPSAPTVAATALTAMAVLVVLVLRFGRLLSWQRPSCLTRTTLDASCE
mmetsp:Transcript_47189/g.117733  ORF Transcript_47189/g.117733 Transcript_47189/m.117733 type:complete len:301 (-) Transcript_47189:285-1187(-)